MAQFILQVLLGRATEGFPVDIDLSKGGYSNSISRRQVSYIYEYLNVKAAVTFLLYVDKNMQNVHLVFNSENNVYITKEAILY